MLQTRNIRIGALLAILFLVTADMMFAQTTSQAPSATVPTTAHVGLAPIANSRQANPTSRQAISVVSPGDGSLQKQFTELQAEFAAIKSGESWTTGLVERMAFIIGMISLIAIGLQGFSLLSQLRLEARNREHSIAEGAVQSAREGELHAKFIALLDFAIRTNDDGTKRAAETLDLVNSLLAITERTAAKASEREYDSLSKEISATDSECLSLLQKSLAEEERSIIAKPEFRRQVSTLARTIDTLASDIKSYNRLLMGHATRSHQPSSVESPTSVRELSLAAACLFIRGQQRNIDQEFPEAINDWRASLNAVGSDNVRLDANYWIAYTDNTLGNFDDALQYLDASLKLSPGIREPELKRLFMETQFFALGLRAVPEQLIEEGLESFAKLDERRYNLTPDRHDRATSSFATTLGNIRLIKWVRDQHNGGIDKSGLHNALESYDKAVAVHEHSRWAVFGRCQVLTLLGKELDETMQNQLRYVFDSAQREYDVRDRQPRSQLLCKATQFMCIQMLQTEANEKEKGQIPSIVGEVKRLAAGLEDRLIFSQFRKQNVDQKTFTKEFDTFKDGNGNMLEAMMFANQREVLRRA